MSADNVKEYMGVVIDYSRDKLLPEQGLSMLTRPGFYKKDWETSPQESFARAAVAYCFGDYDFAQRIYDYASQHWFTNASPVLSNAVEVNWPSFSKEEFDLAGEWLEGNVEPEGMPISCFLVAIPDTKQGLVSASTETKWLSMMGGGVGIYAGMRSPDEKSTGVMAHMAEYDALCLAYKQNRTRRGSIASYLDIDHPEILSFIGMRDPVGGDQNKKCFNLNNAVNISDKFMESVIRGEDYELVDPKHGPTGRKLNARDVWEELLRMRFETGEPYIMWKDTVNRMRPDWITNPHYHVNQSNLCVAPETVILTDKGYETISDLEGEKVNVWNGEEWSTVEVVKTGENQELVTVKTNSGFDLDCTEYHKFYVLEAGGITEKRTYELRPGDKLIKLETPVIQGDIVLDKAYQNGFYSGDGCAVGGKARIYLYGDKRRLVNQFPEKEQHYVQEEQNRELFYVEGLKHKFFVPDASYDVDSRVQWFAGLLDSDGCLLKNGKSQTLQIASTQEGFLESVQLMLQTLGIQTKVVWARDAGKFPLPANDGSGKLKEFECKKVVRLLVNGMGIVKLLSMGMQTHRVKPSGHIPNRDASGFVKVEEIVRTGRVDDTYCFTEPKRNMGVFNGLLTGQCSEITLWTSDSRSAVCCLSSLNLEKYDEWKDTKIVEDLVRYLDNVLEYFIRLAPPELARAVYSAQEERAIGLGTLGYHSYLQSKGIPFESGGLGGASQVTSIIYKSIKDKAVAASKILAYERGEAADCKGSGMRNSALMAIAPNASSASLVGASPSVEPWKDNAFMAEGRAGSFLIKNKYLTELLEKKGMNTEQVWKSILKNNGSVGHLDFLTQQEKKVFATSSEISPMAIIEQAAIRQKFVCQSQSINIFVPKDITMEEMSDIHMKAWGEGVKTLYYCRAEGAERADIGTGADKPLNAVPVRRKIEYDNCISCEG